MIAAYAGREERRKADAGCANHILIQPIAMFRRILEDGTIPKGEEADRGILHWMADLYLYGRYEEGHTFSEMVRVVPPGWLYTHFSPLHETSISNGWRKAWGKCIGEKA